MGVSQEARFSFEFDADAVEVFFLEFVGKGLLHPYGFFLLGDKTVIKRHVEVTDVHIKGPVRRAEFDLQRVGLALPVTA